MTSDESWRTLLPLEQVMLEPYTPNKPDIITVVFSLSKSVSLAFIREVIAPRLLLHPRFSAILTTSSRGTFRYTPAPSFSATSPLLDHHLFEEARIPSNEHARERHRLFTSRLSEILSTPLERTRPLWAAHLFPSFAVSVPATAAAATVVLRIHHSLADGIGLLKYFLAHVADTDTKNNPARLLVPTRRGTTALDPLLPQRSLLRRITDTAADAYNIFFKVLISDPPSVLTRAPVTDTNLCALQAPTHITVATLRKAAAALRITINDLLFTAFSGAIREYVKEGGDDPNALRGLRVAMPFNKHVFDTFQMDDVSNQLVMLPVHLPVCVADRSERLKQCTEHMCRIKQGCQPAFAIGAMRCLGALPSFLRRKVWHQVATGASVLFSNVAGPRERLKIGGVDVPSIFFFPPPDVHVSVDVGIFSYAGSFFFGAAGDASRLRQPQKLLDLIIREIELITEMGEGVSFESKS